jgi:hypothetical protein
MDRLVAHKYGHTQLAIHYLIYLLEEGHISLNASAMKGYEKCLQMMLDVLPKGFDLNYKDGTSPLFCMAGACEYDFSSELWKSIIQGCPDKLLHRIKVPYEEATQKYGNDDDTALSLILNNESAFNDVLRDDFAKACIIQRTSAALCKRRQDARCFYASPHENLVDFNDAKETMMDTNEAAEQSIRGAKLHSILYCLRLLHKEDVADVLPYIATNIGGKASILARLCDRDANGNTPLHLLWNADSVCGDTPRTPINPANKSSTAHSEDCAISLTFKSRTRRRGVELVVLTDTQPWIASLACSVQVAILMQIQLRAWLPTKKMC